MNEMRFSKTQSFYSWVGAGPTLRAAVSLCLLLLPLPCLAEIGHDHKHGAEVEPADSAGESAASCHKDPAASTGEAVVRGAGSLQIPNYAVLDQDGQAVRFYEDLIRGKVVAINFVFTTCTTVCPPMGATFSRLQKLLVEEGREDVALISVSIDPAVDTPARMKRWGQNFKAGQGWTLVTGSKPQIDRLLKGLGVFTVDKTEHSPITLLGNDRTGQWKRTNGLAAPSKIIQELDALTQGVESASLRDEALGR